MKNTSEQQTEKLLFSRGAVIDALNQVKVTFLKGNLGGTADTASIRPIFRTDRRYFNFCGVDFMKHIDIYDIFEKESLIGCEVTVCGWVRTSRDSKNMAFIELNDGTSFKHLQIVIDKAVLSDINEFMKLGTSLKVVGTLVKSAVAVDSVEVNAASIEVLGECPPDYPLQKKRHTLEYLRTIPHLRVRTNTFNAVLRVRSGGRFMSRSGFRRAADWAAGAPMRRPSCGRSTNCGNSSCRCRNLPKSARRWGATSPRSSSAGRF